jgi:hypothetical protein
MQWYEIEIGTGPVFILTETYDVDETCALCLGNMVMYIVVPYTEDIVLLMC